MKYFCLLIVVFLFTCGCTNENKVNYEKFDTRKMLSDITYQLIMPSIEKLNISSNNLNIAVVDYVNSPSEEKIIVIQDLWKERVLLRFLPDISLFDQKAFKTSFSFEVFCISAQNSDLSGDLLIIHQFK